MLCLEEGEESQDMVERGVEEGEDRHSICLCLFIVR